MPVQRLIPNAMLTGCKHPVNVHSLLTSFTLLTMLSAGIISSNISTNTQVNVASVSANRKVGHYVQIPFERPYTSVYRYTHVLVRVMMNTVLVVRPLRRFPNRSVVTSPLPSI